jgi:hypothetical protein
MINYDEKFQKLIKKWIKTMKWMYLPVYFKYIYL